MRVRSPYRFSSVVPVIIGMLLFFYVPNTLKAQDDYDGDSTTQVQPPVEEFDEHDDYSKSQEAPPELRLVPDSTVSQLKKDDDFAYANDDEYLRKPEKARSGRSGSSGDDEGGGFSIPTIPGGNIILYLLLGAFLIFVIWRIVVVNDLYVFRKNKRASGDDEVGEEEINDDNIDEKIRKAIGEKNYRMAVRYQYLKGLRLLSDKGWIRYHAQATNHDYVYQVSQYPVAGEFNFLTRVYDFVWYGEFAVNDEQFTRLQSDFQRFYQAVR